MTLDWFLLLTPLLLLPILLLLSFTGCGTGTIGEPSITFVLHQNLVLVPSPVVTRVHFQWIAEGFGPEEIVSVEDPTQIKNDSGDVVALEFRYPTEGFRSDEIWTVTCVSYAGDVRLGEVSCGPFELTSTPAPVEFEIVSDTSGIVKVQVSPGGCPEPVNFL